MYRTPRVVMLRSLLTFSFAILAVPSVSAQYYGVPGSPSVVVGPAWGGYWPGWGWGYWNGGVNGSFYSNGLSLYGVPVPTHGVTPGFFGGSDLSRNYYNMPPYIGLGWWGYRSPLPNVHGPARDFQQNPLPDDYSGPRFATRDVRSRFAVAKADPVAESERQMFDLNRANYGLRLLVILPSDDCAVYLQGQPMAGTGTERLYQSPVLPAGSSYKYTVTAKLPGDRTETKEVTGRPGETITADFTK